MEKSESKENCPFCKILSGEYDCSEVYSDELVVAFLDIQPINSGHVLVIPREHVSSLNNLDYETGGRLFQVGQKISKAIQKSDIKCEGVNLLLSDGEAAGQEVWHTHLHVVPRYKKDGFVFSRSKQNMEKTSREELKLIAQKISQNI